MICRRCLLAVEDVLITSAIPFNKVVTGVIHLPEKISLNQIDMLSGALASSGLRLTDKRMGGMIEKIKQLVIEKSRNGVEEKGRKQNFLFISRSICIMNIPATVFSFLLLKAAPLITILSNRELKRSKKRLYIRKCLCPKYLLSWNTAALPTFLISSKKLQV